MKTIQVATSLPPFILPKLRRKRPRIYEEWVALKRWKKLPAAELEVWGYLLREAREAEGLSQTEVARRLGCSQQAVSQAERWESNPTANFLRAWAQAVDGGLRLEFC